MGAHMSIYAYGPTYAYKAEQLYTVRPIATYCVFASVENIDVARPIKNFQHGWRSFRPLQMRV